MKLKSILMGASALLLAGSAFGQTTFDVTGATAFRAATLDTIRARFVASGAPFKFQHDQGATLYNGATRSIWRGTFGGVPNVTIRTSFNGSVEGIRAIVDVPAANPTYLNPGAGSAFDNLTPVVGGAEIAGIGGVPLEAAESEAAFSDVSISTTPFQNDPEAPADSPVGVVVFTMLANEGAPANLTNITSQGFRALMSQGFIPLSILTGNPADTTRVFATGRNDGSGTRSAYLSETGYGVATPVNQYVTLASSSTAITRIQLVPQNGVNDSDPVTPGVQPYAGQSSGNSSIVWNQNINGNGGYSSGSTLRTDMGKTSTAVEVRSASHGIQFASIPLHFVTWLSLNDALTAANAGAKVLAYDGVGSSRVDLQACKLEYSIVSPK